MLMRDFLTVFNGGYGMVMAVDPTNVEEIKSRIPDCVSIGEVT